MKRTTVFLGQEDKDAIEAIKSRYGVSTDSDAIRLALRILAQAPQIQFGDGGKRDEQER